ncbi:SDR family oxidoreductase [Bacillus sp. JJ1609]|uniref:SDR family oxidoreductase n=1 Tax=Bacillus sp. JJ1609 TaxID=3122977 RepID=UPI002FFD7800
MRENKVAIVTGASRLKGIGAAICRELAVAGFDIFFTYWTEYDKEMPWGMLNEEPQALKDELEKMGVKSFSMELDLTKENSPQKLFESLTLKWQSADVLVNNAAYSTSNDFSNLTTAELDRHYLVNIRATTLMSIEFARRFNKNSGGRIINMTSGQFRGPMPGELAYATTKGAIDALTITLSAELASRGITVNAVNPGPTDTGWMDDETKKALLQRFPFGRVGKTEDAAKLVKFLASEEAEWITGQILHSEGGFLR